MFDYFLNKLAKDNGYKALLSGEGADELFAGYIDYGFNTKVKFIRWVTDQLKKMPRERRETLPRPRAYVPQLSASTGYFYWPSIHL